MGYEFAYIFSSEKRVSGLKPWHICFESFVSR